MAMRVAAQAQPPRVESIPVMVDAPPTEPVLVHTVELPTLVRAPDGKRPPNAPLTETGVVFGTPSYMAAELVAGTKSATRSADVFSLAVIAFELLTGRRPFKDSPLQARMDGRDLPLAPRFIEVCPSLDARVAEMLDRAIGHDPAARPTAQDLAGALRAASDATGLRAPVA
jgi:serine/threonine-protein kinase